MLRFLRANLEPPAGLLGAALELAQEPRTRPRGMEAGLGWLIARGRRGASERMHWHNGGAGGFRSRVSSPR